jgi:hypothetical protein
MNELNSDWVLWGSILTVVFSLVALIAYGWKAFKAMEGMDDSSDSK